MKMNRLYMCLVVAYVINAFAVLGWDSDACVIFFLPGIFEFAGHVLLWSI